MQQAGDRVAVVLADQWMPGLTGPELLGRVPDLHPQAKRALLVGWGDWGDEPTADAIRVAMALGRIDYYALKPWKSPDAAHLPDGDRVPPRAGRAPMPQYRR